MLCERGAMPTSRRSSTRLAKEFVQGSGGDTKQIILGTPEYLAPRPRPACRPAGDLYALGAVGYFLLTASACSRARSASRRSCSTSTATPRPPSELAPVPPELEALVLACLAKSPAARPTAAELQAALRALPAQPGWSEALAAGWWRDVHTAEATDAGSSLPTMATITVDLEHRR